MTTSQWAAPEKEFDTAFNQKVLQQRMVHVIMKLNSAFVKEADTTKVILVLAQTPTLIHMKIRNQNKGTPYCDYFYFEEEMIWCSAHPKSPKVILRHSQYSNFFKKTMLEGRIRAGAEDGAKDQNKPYYPWIQK